MKRLLLAANTMWLTDCGVGLMPLDTAQIYRGIREWFDDSGVGISSVECPAPIMKQTGETWRCQATDPWGLSVDVIVEMTNSDGYVELWVAP